MGTNFNALAMDPLGHVAGTASSVVSSLQTILGGALGAIIGFAYDGTVLPLSLGFLILSRDHRADRAEAVVRSPRLRRALTG